MLAATRRLMKGAEKLPGIASEEIRFQSCPLPLLQANFLQHFCREANRLTLRRFVLLFLLNR